MRVQVKRLFHGFASIRDYIVEKAKRNKESIVIECNDETMTIAWRDLDKGFKNYELFTSKHDDRQYALIDYDWIADHKQQRLFT